MREIGLGHWHYFTWHLPASVMMLGASLVALAMACSLWRNQYGHAARALRWNILGWSALLAAITAGVASPYLRAAARVRVDSYGTWYLSNYLGIPLATLPATEVRRIRAVDLGGLGYGIGHLEIYRENGSVIRTVRLSRDVLDQTRTALGYSHAMVRDCYGDQWIAPHRYTPAGPVALGVPCSWR